MTTLVIDDHEALRVALDSGLVPAEVQSAPLRFALDDEGRLYIEPSVEIRRGDRKRLRDAGVGSSRRRLREGQDASCWAELLPPTAAPEPEPPLGEVLFVSEGDEGFLRVSGELLRLGSDDQRLAFFEDEAGVRRNLCRVPDPPYYALLRALDRDDPLRAFIPTRPGGRVWLEVGAAHPQAGRLEGEPGQLVLIPRPQPSAAWTPWLRVPDGPWVDLHAVSDVTLPAMTRWTEAKPARRLTVALRLVRGPSRRPADLWVLRERGLDQVEELVRTVPDEIVARLRFAVVERDDPLRGGKTTMVILRARRSAKGPPALDLDAEAYVPAQQIPELYLPAGTVIDPPLRPSRVRELLGSDPERVVWLAEIGEAGRRGRSFVRESLAESAFAPLDEWVDYLVGADEARLEPWVRAAMFDLDSYVSINAEWADGVQPGPAPKRPAKEPRRRRPLPAHTLSEAEPSDAADVLPARVEAPTPEVELAPIELPRSDIEIHLAALERTFCELDSPLDAPERRAMWAEIGNLQAALHRSREAGLCWSRALWERPSEAGGPSQLALARRWVESECAMLGYPNGSHMLGIVDVVDADLDEQMVRALAAEVVYAELFRGASEAGQTRAAASLAQAPPPLTGQMLTRLQRFFAHHGGLLDLRTLWLARGALARLAGDDRLALFQTRDLIMASLRDGVGLARNIPTFVRTHGNDSDAGDLGRLADELVLVRDSFVETKRERSTIEKTFPEEMTRGYVHMVLAWGFARVGRSSLAREQLDAARGTLGDRLEPPPVGDPLHIAVFAAYGARVEQALEGLPPGAPMSTAPGGPIAAREQLSDIDRYKYNRVTQLSRILDPRHDVDAFLRWSQKEDEPFEGLALLDEPEALAALFDRMLAEMSEIGDEPRAQRLDELLEYLEALPEPLAIPRLQHALRFVVTVPLAARPKLLRNSLLLAGYYDHVDLINEALSALALSDAELTETRPADYASLLTRCASVLRRSGHEAQLATLLTKLEERVGQGRELDSIVAQLHIASGFAALGQPDRVQTAFAAAHALLPEVETFPNKYQTLMREIAVALSRSTPGQAIASARTLMQRLVNTTDNMSTNSHFCLAVIHLMETVVLSLASEDLALSEWARRWVEDDEHLLHRRIHRDLSAGAAR